MKYLSLKLFVFLIAFVSYQTMKCQVSENFENERRVLREKGPLFQSVRKNMEWARLSRNGITRFGRTGAILEQGEQYKYSEGTYSYSCNLSGFEYSRIDGFHSDYSQPFDNCLHCPKTIYTIKVSSNQIVFSLDEEVQVSCDVDSKTGNPVVPDDPYLKKWGCNSNSLSFVCSLSGLNEKPLKCKVNSSCSHTCYQPIRSHRGGTVVRKEPKASYVYKKMDLSDHADPYAPWRLGHNSTITINLQEMAAMNQLTKKQLALQLIMGGMKYIPTIKASKTAPLVCFNIPDFDSQNLICYFLWKACGLSESDFEDYLNSIYNQALIDIEKGDVASAQEKVYLISSLDNTEIAKRLLQDLSKKADLKINAQCSIKPVDNAVVAVQASYPGGDSDLLRFVSDNLVYPEIAKKQGVEGVVIIKLLINIDGTVGTVKIKKSLSPQCDQAAKDVVSQLKFTPAKNEQGQQVPVWFTLPIMFRL